MMQDIRARLAERGLALLEPPAPGGAYQSVRLVGPTAYVSAQFPFESGELAYRGRLGRELSTHDGIRAAELCALNVLAQLDRHVGFDRVLGLGRIEAYMQTTPGWDEFPRVLDGASQLFRHVLGDVGSHARALFGVERLPLDAPIELTAVAALRS